ncbi:unnamed protein product [Nesidiocoris tenuis]|uniref:EamA domain-containing protein n=1 Tax=Nesidiocoris tenuis TaxID=355587 RepID=A0A6H5GSW9_9HEMI|nr:unnamed protein product [Nesidiocoris tenuis]
MAWTSYQVLLAVVMVTTGSINTLTTKWADKLDAKGSDGKSRPFDHPFVQSACMFLGEFLCLVVFKTLFFVYSRRADGTVETNTITAGSQEFSPFILFPAAMCDMIGTSLMYVGLNLTNPSSFQMLRGDLIIVIAQIITATQMVYEEKFVNTKNIPPLQAVGWEGLFGLVVTGLLLIPFYFIHVPERFGDNAHGVLEDLPDALIQMGNNKLIIVSLIGTIISIAFFNFAGISVTKELSATTRMILDSVRTLVIWGFSLIVKWQGFHILQVKWSIVC